MPVSKTTGIVEVACLAANAAGTAGRDHVDLPADEVGGQSRQPVVVILRPTIFEHHALPFDMAGFAQPLAERSHISCKWAGSRAAEEADHRHRPLLRA